MTLAIVNARVWTGDTARPAAEAVAIAGERIAALGTSEEIRRLAGGAEIVDAGGLFLVPGFIDAHVHFLDGGQRLASVQLRDAKTRDEFTARIAAFATTVPAGTWITGGDWDHSLWGGQLPRRDWIDAVTPDHPVRINRLDGHMALANSAALTASGVARGVKEVSGGEIVRDGRGELTGGFKDNAMDLVGAKVPPAPPDLLDRDLTAGRLDTRINAVVPLNTWQRLADTVKAGTYGPAGRGDAWLQIGGLKGFVDGSLGSHTAALVESFTHAPTDRGLFVNTPEDLYAWINGADAAGFQVMVHAVGDRANQTLLDIFERVANEHGARDRRFRVEHAQHLAPADIPRFGRLRVIPSMQPYHAIDDGRWAEAVIGPARCEGHLRLQGPARRRGLARLRQ